MTKLSRNSAKQVIIQKSLLKKSLVDQLIWQAKSGWKASESAVKFSPNTHTVQYNLRLQYQAGVGSQGGLEGRRSERQQVDHMVLTQLQMLQHSESLTQTDWNTHSVALWWKGYAT